MNEKIIIKTTQQFELIDITKNINKVVKKSKLVNGLCIVQTTHATASIIICPKEKKLQMDFLNIFNNLVPSKMQYQHDKIDGNARAHLLSSLFGININMLVENNQLVLGTYQQIFFVEFDGPKNSREVIVNLIKISN